MSRTHPEIFVIGASAGAVQALLHILPGLPADWQGVVLAAVHVPPDRDNMLIPLLQGRCAVTVKEAEDKEPIEAGAVYLAPSDYHLLVERDGALALSSEEEVHYSRPSIDVLFETAADAWGDSLTGLILTGANADGARGLQAVARHGGRAIVERPSEAYASAMPEAAIELCQGVTIMTLDEIRDTLLAAGGPR